MAPAVQGSTPDPLACGGVIVRLQKAFGFIRCASSQRSLDIFFHFSELTQPPAEVGQEVLFSLGQDTRSGRSVARSVRPAPPGTVTFEQLSPSWCLGQIIEAPTGAEPGLLRCLEDGRPTHVTFHRDVPPPAAAASAPSLSPPDATPTSPGAAAAAAAAATAGGGAATLLAPGAFVLFRLATHLRGAELAKASGSNAQRLASRRACQVTPYLPPPPKLAGIPLHPPSPTASNSPAASAARTDAAPALPTPAEVEPQRQILALLFEVAPDVAVG